MTDDLATWLLAQLDADEASEWPHRPSCQMLKPPPVELREFFGSGFSCNCDAATRWMLDTEVKRTIIGQQVRQLADDSMDESANWMLAVLALPYANRPGYQKAWKP